MQYNERRQYIHTIYLHTPNLHRSGGAERQLTRPHLCLHPYLFGAHAVLQMFDHVEGLVGVVAVDKQCHLVHHLQGRGRGGEGEGTRGSEEGRGGMEGGRERPRGRGAPEEGAGRSGDGWIGHPGPHLVVKVLDRDDVAAGGERDDALLHHRGEHLEAHGQRSRGGGGGRSPSRRSTSRPPQRSSSVEAARYCRGGAGGVRRGAAGSRSGSETETPALLLLLPTPRSNSAPTATAAPGGKQRRGGGRGAEGMRVR